MKQSQELVAILRDRLASGSKRQTNCDTSPKLLAFCENCVYQVAEELSAASRISLRGQDSRRLVFGGTRKFQEDPIWRDLIQFYEYFHGDNCVGLGASHQSGWTGVVAA